MKRRNKKIDHRPKTKEELLADLKQNAEWIAKMKFVKEEFYPALCEASQSIDDASVLLAGFNTQIMEQFLVRMKDVKISDLNLQEKLDKESPKYAENHKLLNLFLEKSVFEAKELIEGLKNEIALFEKEEMESRPLSSLKTKWMDEA